ncbi:hypothetical protein C8Q73DRAFT_639748 [Cubamyces lactineus]|nr:hypothetical protein C8Q73DRAFT_639748 [Cubamyces lactineus]
MREWLPLVDEYLHELLRNEGRGDHTYLQCPTCVTNSLPTVAGPAKIRCKECAPRLLCEACTISRHVDNPWHRMERWTGHAFEGISLADLGLVIQLGHADRSVCSNPRPARADFCVIDVSGQHRANVLFCGCEHAGMSGTPSQQLHRHRLYPATDTEPNTALTYRVLEHYHIQSLQGKMSMFDYYQSLLRLTDNTGTTYLQDRYKVFMRVVSQWRFLKRLKRAGRGHDVSGVNGTRFGELAVHCPTCPRPGVNLPKGWDIVPEDRRYLYQLTIAMDACFRLKRRAVSNEQKDPILGSGWGYFVEDVRYREVLAAYADQEEMSTCTGLSAIDHANTKYHKGYAATGVGAVVCARHEFMLANGVGDMQKGEKYVNMDYVFASSMSHHRLVRKHVSYDIACQWSKGLKDRLAEFPEHVRIEVPDDTDYSIPKLHYHSHKQIDHSKHSMNYRPGAGRTDGEGIERRWWWIQPIATSTKMMGPGQRQGVLEDQWGYANWRKYVIIAWTLRDRLRVALREQAEHMELFVALTASLKRKHIKRWTAAVVAWEKDSTLEDPYMLISDGPTESDVRRKLAEEEQVASAVPGYIAQHEVSVLGFITMGLDIEDQQYRLQQDTKKTLPSDLPVLLERRTALRRRIQKFRDLQAVYMPATLPLLSQVPQARTDVEHIESVRLGLPSDIATAHRAVVCSDDVIKLELRLREAQCRDSLQDVRNKLHTLDHLYKYKRANVRNQGPNTRAQAELAQQRVRRDRAAARYRRARQARLNLEGPGAWELEFQVLRDEDVRGVGDDEPQSVLQGHRQSASSGVGEGRKKMSWIWNASDKSGDQAHVESLRIEWLKARARALRWQEETELLPEEMRRVLAAMESEASHWETCAAQVRTDVSEEIQEGLKAYALDQMLIFRAMRDTFISVCYKQVIAAGGGEG